MTTPTLIAAGHTERLSALHTLQEGVGPVLERHLDRLVIQVEQAAVAAGHRPPRGGQLMVFLEVRYDAFAGGHPEDCPECRAGKHANCTGQAYDAETDSFVDCGCQAGGHA